MKTYASLIFLSCLFVTMSCKKDKRGDFFITGKVINVGSKEPIDSVLVILHGGNPLNNPLMPDFNDNPPSGNNDTAYTNTNGEFSLNVYNESVVYLGWVKEGYKNGKVVWYANDYTVKLKEEGNIFSNPRSQSIIIEYGANCECLPTFEKQGGKSSKDTLIVSIATYNYPTHFVEYRTFVGRSPHTMDSDFGYCTGDTYYYLKIDYTENDKWHTKYDSIYVRSFETLYDTIYY